MNKPTPAFVIQGLLRVSIAFVAFAMIALVACQTSPGIIGNNISLAFQLGFAGAVYLVLVPILRMFPYGMPPELHHLGLMFMGLCVATFAGSNLLRVSLMTFNGAIPCLLFPPIIVYLAHLLKQKMQIQENT